MRSQGVSASCGLILLVAILGCGSSSASSDGGTHPHDGSLDQPATAIRTPADGAADGGATDGGACGCTTDGQVLHMSWACYCAAYGCPTVKPNCGPLFTWTSACGRLVGTWNNAGVVNKRVFDSKGAVVAVRLSSGMAEYGCGGDHTGTATIIQAGELPADSCTPQPCVCNLDGTVDCSVADGGTL
ncbi:MAG: hypothetical protein ABUS79_09080 [Pseudomonadota bacterium]